MQNSSSQFFMSDIGEKPPTNRLAIATGKISVNAETFALIRDRKLKKGDALILAEVAGIDGAKKASDTILLCHPISLDHVKITLELDEKTNSITANALVAAFAKTGVEMEAIAAVNSALITVYDLAKMYDPAPEISDIRLLFKKGGKKGLWTNPRGVPQWVEDFIKKEFLPEKPLLQNVRTSIITISDRAAAGVYEDESGKVIESILKNEGSEIVSYKIVADEKNLIKEAIEKICNEERPQLIITTGGTGVSSRDVTPEAIRELTSHIIPGVGELLRINGAKFTKNSWSSRSLAAVYSGSLLIALPGRPKAVKESLDCLLPILPHLIQTISDKKHD